VATPGTCSIPAPVPKLIQREEWRFLEGRFLLKPIRLHHKPWDFILALIQKKWRSQTFPCLDFSYFLFGIKKMLPCKDRW